jgi:4-alpha-glucanotransferase
MKPLFNWLRKRSAGVLLHPTAFPGDYGIGTLGQEAREFVDFLHAAGMRYWQICPLGPTGYGDSPYQSFSAFAGSPYLIDLEALVEADLLSEDSLAPLLNLSDDRVDFGRIYRIKRPVLRQAFEVYRRDRTRELPYGDFDRFRERHSDWLEPYSYFQALKDHFGGGSFLAWPKGCADHSAALRSPLRKKLALEIETHQFNQYLFFGQWSEIRSYAARRKIGIIGDMPIFVASDSADLWTDPHLFKMDRRRRVLTERAGCPPDYFAVDGQLWGNPLYDWNVMAADDYAWWRRRLAANFALFDVVRLDHFRGFDTYWSIPEKAESAVTGKWLQGPGLPFFKSIKKHFPDARIIAEDLGELFPSVIELREKTGLPGMAITQFAFGGKADNLYLPHNLTANTVLYPGTHDNDTTRGWYESETIEVQDHVRRYLRLDGEEVAWDFLRSAYASVCRMAVFPFQDLLNLGSEARFNTPGRASGNWIWRYRSDQLKDLKNDSADYLRKLAELYGR